MNIRVKTNDGADLGAFIAFIKTIEECCRTGASRDLHLSVDGDGSAKMFFEFEDLPGVKEINPGNLDGGLNFSIGE